MDTDLDMENESSPPPAEAAEAAMAPAAVPAARPSVLALANEPQMRLTHDDVVYDPVPSDAALGALLFALQPADVAFGAARHGDRLPLRMALDSARQFQRVLGRYVARADRDTVVLPGRVTVADLRDWVLQAAKSVPAAEQERFCWRLARALGPDPWGDGSPAIELSGQQFALFETRFDEAGLPVVEPAPEAEPHAARALEAPPEPATAAPAEAVADVAQEAADAPAAITDEDATPPADPPAPATPKKPRASRARKKPEAPTDVPPADG